MAGIGGSGLNFGNGLAYRQGLGSSGLQGDSADSLLPGAVGVWYASQYDATSFAVPNALASSPLSTNLLRAPRRIFTNSSFWSNSGITIVDEATTAPDGTSEASTFACTGSWSFSCNANNGNIPAGTYTLSVWVKRNAVTDQTFRIIGNLADPGTYSAVKTATSSWQQFTHTFTLASSTAPTSVKPLFHDGVPSAANLAVIDVELFAGASAGTTAQLVGHWYFSKSKYSTVPTVSGGLVNLSSGESGGLAQFASNTTYSSFTVVAVASKVANNAKNFQGIISKAQSWTTFTAFFERQDLPRNQFGSSDTGPTQATGAWEPYNQGVISFACSYNGTTGANQVWLNGSPITRDTSTTGQIQSARDFFIGALNTLGNNCDYSISSIAFYPFELTPTQMASVNSYLFNKARQSGLSVPSQRIIIGEGDSLTANSGSMFYLSVPSTNPFRIGGCRAVAGSTLANLVSRAAVDNQIIPADKGNTTYVLSVLIGTNDLSSYPGGGAAYITALQSYLTTMKTGRWTICLATIPPRNDATFNTNRAIVNSWIRSSAVAGGYADVIADYASDPTYGTDAAAANPLYYSDGIHPTALVNQAFATSYLIPALNSLP